MLKCDIPFYWRTFVNCPKFLKQLAVHCKNQKHAQRFGVFKNFELMDHMDFIHINTNLARLVFRLKVEIVMAISLIRQMRSPCLCSVRNCPYRMHIKTCLMSIYKCGTYVAGF